MIVHGDNLEALKGLMPYYRQRVKLVEARLPGTVVLCTRAEGSKHSR